MKKTIPVILTLALVLGCFFGAAAFADEPAPSPTPVPSVLVTPPSSAAQIPEGADEQINLLFSQFDGLKQSDDASRWCYAVTDLDHDGLLELLAGTVQGSGRYTTVKAWRVQPDKQSLGEISINVPEGDSFPDIVIDAADTFHDKDTNYWYYMFNDHVVVSSKEVYANKSAIALVGNELQYCTYAYQHNEWTDGHLVTTFTNRDNEVITPEQYNSVGEDVFAKMERGTVHFDWFLASEASSATRFTDSYAVFLGLRQPPKPDASDVTPNPDTPSNYLMITKNPTDESHTAGETAWFIAKADNWNTASWTFIDPYGNQCSWQSFNNRFPDATVSGGDSSSLSIYNTNTGMNGWGAYCTFYGNGQTARSTTAYLYIQAAPPSYGQMDATVTGCAMNSVSLDLANGDNVTISMQICQIDGEIEEGDAATVYYADYPSSDNIYSCIIYGSEPTPGQMDGSVSGYAMNSVDIALDNGDSVTVSMDICQIDGNLSEGCSATVYYNNYPSSDNIYACYIQGSYDPDPGQMGASFAGATMDGDNFALDNGDYVTVAQNLCSSIGKVTYGDSATVYYSGGYPSAENIYHVDIYGRVYDGDDDDNPDDPDNPDGPWIDPVLPPDPDNPDPWVGPVLPPENGGFNPNVNQTLGGFKQ